MLFKEIQGGNTHAFDELFLRYHDKLLAFALQYVKQLESAEEITSELFVKIWLKRAMLTNILNPEIYLFISIKNACLNWLRSNHKKSRLVTVSSDEQSLDIVSAYQTTIAEEKELSRILDLIVAKLPEQRRLIFKLIKEQGLKRHEVAEILGISIRTVENQLHKAIITLAEAISGYLGYDPRKKTSKTQKTFLITSLFFLW
ncbi:RNA polymerase sigma-70 factor [Pedobacter boryungensis]|uniref:RNA polymerase sigma-70 factor n=1 Tax=Pedobacter boryungensis TaxID=869962 RepID=A0ABX2DCL1_9SPHI|nr:RNA polymerase sigma-70 factor [Pedobacter boryungensis]